MYSNLFSLVLERFKYYCGLVAQSCAVKLEFQRNSTICSFRDEDFACCYGLKSISYCKTSALVYELSFYCVFLSWNKIGVLNFVYDDSFLVYLSLVITACLVLCGSLNVREVDCLVLILDVSVNSTLVCMSSNE